MTPPAIPGWICEEAIGHGADATVWRARPAAGGAALALKVIPLARLRDPAAHLREAWAAGSTGCRQVVAVHDAGQHGDCAWLAMELAHEDAAMLAARCGGRLRPATAARIARDVARGLQALADHGFVHRDVKPSNILLRADGSAMIGDLAPLRGGGTATRSADLSGTPAYLSPEQIRGSAPDVRSDVHALGATMFALIAGRTPFTADGALDLLRAIAEQDAPDLRTLVPDVPPAIAEVIATALAKDPVLRQQRPILLAAELDEALAGRAPSRAAAPAVRVAPPAAGPAAWPAWLPAAAAGVAALVGLAVGALAARPSASALAAEAAAAETAAIAWRDRQRAETDEAVIATLRQRLDRLRLERDRLDQRRPAQPASAPTRTPAVPAAPATAVAPTPPPAAVPTATPAEPSPVAAAKPVATPVVPARTEPPPAAPPAPASPPAAESLPEPPADAPEPRLALSRMSLCTLDQAWNLAGVVVNPLRPDELVTWDTGLNLWLSTDAGRNWNLLDQQEIDARGGRSSQKAGNKACWSGSNAFIPAGVNRLGWISSDGGRHWRRVANPGLPVPVAARIEIEHRVMLSDGSLVVAVSDPDKSRNWLLFTSRNAGASWAASGQAAGDRLIMRAAGSHLLLATLQSGRWVACTDGTTWNAVYGGLREVSAWSLDYARLRLAAQNGGFAVLDLASGRWVAETLSPPSGATMSVFAVHPRQPATVFTVDEAQGLMATGDGGRTWRPFGYQLDGNPVALELMGTRRPRLVCACDRTIAIIDLATPLQELFPEPPKAGEDVVRWTSPPGRNRFVGGLACNPARPGEMVAWGLPGLWRSRDGGGSWEGVGTPPWSSLNEVRISFSSQRKSFVITLGCENLAAYIADDDSGLAAPIGGLDARRMIDGPVITDAGVMVAAVQRAADPAELTRIASSRDGGRTWQDGNLMPVQEVHLVPVSGGLAILHSDGSDAFVSLDGGKSSIPAGLGTGSYGLADAWHSDGQRLWTVDRDWRRLLCFDVKTRRWRSQELTGLAGAMGFASWQAFVVDPSDAGRLWVVGRDNRFVHSKDGGRTWRAFGLPFRGGHMASIDLLRGPKPRVALMCADGIMLLDAGPAGSALFTRPLAAPP